MQRDLDLIRNILTGVENAAHGEAVQGVEGTSADIFAYHVMLLDEAGLVDALVRKDSRGFPAVAIVKRLTMAGHDMVEAARNEGVWKEAVAKIAKAGGAWSVGFLAELLKLEIKKRLGLGGEE